MEEDVAADGRSSFQAGSKAVPDPEADASLVIPDHELLRCIGRGSYGTVWLARSMMGVFRAVKIVYRNSFADHHPFERELAGIRKFEPISRSHEGFVDVLQVGINEDQGYFYYVMEIADDQLLGQKIRPDTYHPKTLAKEIHLRRKLSFQECLELGLALSLALSELHKHGLVHRDIKPSNIIFVHGIPKLADIGLVTEANQAQSFVGTVGFIPPEGPGSPQADVYSLGKVLYEASTGKDRQDFPELPTLLDTLSDRENFLELNEVILHACKNDVAGRYQSAWFLHADLVVLANGKSVRRLKALERRLSHVKRAAGISALGLVLAGIISYQIYREWELRDAAHQREVGATIAYGNQAMESGNLLDALPYFADAVQLDPRNLSYRMRLGAVLSECPKLTQMCFEGVQTDDGQFSPDGKNILIAQEYGSAKIYDLQTGKLSVPPFGPQELMDASYSPGHSIVTADGTGYVDVWDAATLKRLHHFRHSDLVYSARFAPDGCHVVTGCKDKIARVWDVRTGKVVLELQHNATVRYAEFSRDGKLIVTGSQDHTAQVWDASTGRKIGKPLRHDNWVKCAAFSPDGTKLVTACSDHRARVWDVATGRRISADLLHHDEVNNAEFSPDGRLLLTASYDGTVRLWHADTFEPFEAIPVLRHGEKVMHASFDADGRRIVSVCVDGTVRVWDLAGGELPTPIPHSVFSCDGGKSLEITNGGVVIRNLSEATSVSITSPYSTEKANFSHNGKFAFTVSVVQTNGGTAFRSIQIWNTTTGTSVAPEIVLANRSNRWAVSDDGHRLAVVSDTNVQFWDIQSRTALTPVITNRFPVNSVIFSRDGRLAAAMTGNKVCVWTTTNGLPALPPLKHSQAVASIDFSADGRWLASSCSDKSLARCYAQIWNLSTGQPAGPQLMHGDGVKCVRFSPDGTRIATASEDFTGAIWDRASGRRLATLPHNDQVQTICFSPDGTQVVTASSDKTARVWSVESGAPLTPPFQHIKKLASAQFVNGGNQIVTIDIDGGRRIWDLPLQKRKPEELRNLACLLSSKMETPTHSLASFPPGALAVIWKQLRTGYPSEFTISPAEIIAWHEHEAVKCEYNKQWPAAVFHLERLLANRAQLPDVGKRLEEAKSHLNDTNQ